MPSAGKGVWGMLPQDLLKNPHTLVPSGTFSCSSKSDYLKLKKKNQQQKTVAAAKNHINKKNYSMNYHVILGRFKWLINGFTEFMIEQ